MMNKNNESNKSTVDAAGVGANVRGVSGAYEFRVAGSSAEVSLAQRLRYEVFNVELGEGLAESAETGLDVDAFDSVCDHLLILHEGFVVGTYRMQTGISAKRNMGYYSEQEFDFSPFESIRSEVLELGRACVHKEHRNLNVLHLLWRGIARYAEAEGSRYLIGCSSLTSQDEGQGWAMYEKLARRFLAPPELQTHPLPSVAVIRSADPEKARQECPAPPKLLRAYLGIGGKICGPPAIDREFRTIDFLTVLDLKTMPAIVRQHFFGRSDW